MKLKFHSKIKPFILVLFLTFGVSGLTIALSYLKIFQSGEWSTYDAWFRFRSTEAEEKHIVVVTINESDIRQIGQWPISDLTMSQAIAKIRQQQPRVIGLDLYRDLPVAPGTRELEAILRSTPNLIGVEKVIGEKIQPSAILKEQNQVALSDLVRDGDGKIRRGLLSVELEDGQIQLALGTRLALMYLAAAEIFPEAIADTDKLALGKGIFRPFRSNDAGYVGADDGGFQVLINYRGAEDSFNHVSITDVLNNNIPHNLFRDRLVLIGSTASSLNDFFPTPYSNSRENKLQDLPGVFIHANIASQIITMALEGRSSIKTINESLEWSWIFAWTCGASMLNILLLNRQSNSQQAIVSSTFFAIVTTGIAILGSSYLLFLGGFWLTVITPLFSVAVSGIIINWYYQINQEKLAFTDSLTEISNRRFFDEFLSKQWQNHKTQGQSLSVILCDVDFFKKYNDTYGHQAGDLCLKQVAQTLAQSVRKDDLAARYGGEEFVAVLPNTSPDLAIKVAQRMCDRLKSLQIDHASSPASKYVSISCGIACTSVISVHSPEELIEYADKALYLAKEQGRDRAILWQEP